MRILYLCPVGFIGGAERVVLNLIAGVKQLSNETELGLIAGGPGPLVEEARALGAWAETVALPRELAEVGDSGLRERPWAHSLNFLSRLPRGGWHFFRCVSELKQAAKAFGPDVIHSNGPKMHLLSAPLFLPADWVWHLHDFMGQRPAMRQLLRPLSRKPKAVFACSQSVADDGGRVLRRGLPIHVLHNAVDTSLFSPGEGAADGALAKPNSLRVGLLATYARWKGQDIFLRAAAGALRSRPDIPFHFYVIGGPVYATANSQWTLEELQQLAEGLGISSYVSFLPFQTDMVSCYRALDIAVHASVRPEPFGLTIAEAMACGKAVVASRDSGAAELISSGEALTLPRVEVGPLAEAIIDLAEHGERRRQMGVAARAAAVDKFGREQMARRALALYESLRRPA